METVHHSGHNSNKKAHDLASKILVILLIVVSVLVIFAMGLKIFFVRQNSRDVKKKQYQAVFLTNGQVYFGKMSRPDDSYVKLTDIYYLQSQPAQPAAGSNTTTQGQQSLSLAKLGSELHGPEDNMFIANDQVLFWENLKDDGKVVQAIKSYQGGNKQ